MQNLCCCHWHRLKAPLTLCVIVIEWLPTNDSVDISFEQAFSFRCLISCNAFNYVCKLYWIRLPDAHCCFGVQLSITHTQVEHFPFNLSKSL